MRLSPEALSLVMEIQVNETLHRAYIISASRAQFYRTTDLHLRDHFQLCGEATVTNYKHHLEKEGLQEVEPDLIDDPSYTGIPCFSILSGDKNYFLQDLVVINFIEDKELLELARKTKLTQLGVHLLECGHQDESLKDSEDRGNYRTDIGFTPKSHRDKSVFKGMNVPHFTSWSNKKSGIEGDSSLTVSIIKGACALTEFVEALKTRFLLPWDDFSGEARREYFPRRIARAHNIADYKNFHSEGVTASVTGTMPDGTLKLLTRHRDKLNGRVSTHNMYRALSFTEDLHYPGWSAPVSVRIALGEYGKECIDQVCVRVKRCGDLLKKFGEWRDRNQHLFVIEPEKLLSVQKRHQFRAFRPKADKAVYYSIFIHGITILGQRTRFDKAILFEAVMAMTLSPSPSAWFGGLMHAESVRGSDNLIVVFINHMVSTYKSVSAGAYRRRQVSTRANMLWTDLWLSLRNMVTLVNRAASTDYKTTDDFIGSWSGAPKHGGVQGAGPLVSQEQVYVFTALSLIRTAKHVNNTFVGTNNHTAKRLDDLGLREPRHRVEFLRVVSQTYGMSMCVAENSLCEWLREENGCDGRFFDTIARGQKLYTMNEEGRLFSHDRHGMMEIVKPKNWQFDAANYDDGVRWWDPNFDINSAKGSVTLSTNKKTKRSAKRSRA